ncbi:hypothetical protein PTKIN_Ptkin10aG0042900 [Pterospermum kingtungense]
MSWKETRPNIIVADTELMKLVLTDKNGDFVKPPANPLVSLLQMGVATLEGKKWAKRRRLITPAFHLQKLKEMIPAAFAISCSNLIERWTKFVSPEGSSELDVAPDFHNLASDVIARADFGSSYEEGKKIFELQKEQAILVLKAFYSFHIPGFRYHRGMQIVLLCWPGDHSQLAHIDIDHLIYVSMILHEVLRLYPPITVLARHTRKRTTIGGISIPVGVNIQLLALLLHYELEYWGDDVKEFKPERFAEGIFKASKDQMAFYPFDWGPRFCLGQSFAMIEAKMALAMVLQHLWFELSPSYIHAPYQAITLQPQHGAPIILHQI